MEILSVIAAALASYVFGAVWYMMLARPWMAAAGLKAGPDGRPANSASPAPYIIALVCALAVAGMMRHVFSLAGIDDAAKGLVSGLGIGLFFATPWIATNYGFSDRPKMLTVIDGGYATIGCGLMGLVLTLF